MINILFIEDEKELAATGAEQLESRGYKVFSASTLAEARAILNTPGQTVNYIITDHRLDDGWGIEFILDLEGSFPLTKCAVVSGYLTQVNTDQLKQHGILYFRKPLLYAKVIDELRRQNMKTAPVSAIPSTHDKTSPEATPAPEQSKPKAEEPKKRKGLSLWPFNTNK
ncbi:MAG: response regulator [Puniceicoccaceae bacterium]|nr:MAG: response regulator [Puniceicoccaceae bacterium]